MDDATRRQLQVVEAYRQVFTTPHGQTVLEDLQKSFFIERSTFVQGDSHQSAYHEGMRAVVLEIQRMVALAHNQDYALALLTDEETDNG